MEGTGVSLETQAIIAIAACFAVMVVIAAIELWYATAGDDRTDKP